MVLNHLLLHELGVISLTGNIQYNFNGSYTEVRSVNCEVPRRSCFFSIFTNNLPLILNCATIATYADDFTSVHRPAELCRVLNGELKLIEEWVPVNKLVLNIEKTKCMVLGSKHSSKVNYR